MKAVEKDTEVYTVDCGLGARELLAQGCKVTTIDHHVGAKETFEELAKENPDYKFIFDNEKSGASLAWSYFFPEEDQPELITLVEDLDLWRWKYGEDTKDVNNYLSMYRNKPEHLLEIMQRDLDDIKQKGKIISQHVDGLIAKQTSLSLINLKIGEYLVLAYNITVFESESGNILSKKQDKTVAMFTISGDTVDISFRSKEHHLPTSLDLAKALGGGGHKCASGARVPLQVFLKMLVIETNENT